MHKNEFYVGKNLYKDNSLEAQINQKIVEKYLDIDEFGNLLSPPSTDDELHEFIFLAYGIFLPRKVITPGHSSPFSFVADLFFQRVQTALGFANRSGGKTYAVAILNSLDLIFKPGCEVASAGAVMDQAEKCYRYFQDFNNLPFFQKFSEKYVKVTGVPLLGRSIKSKTQFGNGSILEIITGTEKGLRGPHPHKFRFDEIDELEWDVFQTGLSMSHSSKGILGQDIFTSTRQKADGPMNRLLSEAEEKGIKVYEWNIWEALEKCTRRCVNDPEHGTCPILKFCQGKAHECEGFYKIEDFIKKVRLIDRHRWNTEWLNKEPLGYKLVFHMFSESRHLMTPEKLREMTGYSYPQPSWYRVSGIDFGSSPGNPFVYVKFAKMPNGAWLLFYEYFAEQRLLRDHAETIKGSPLFSPSETIYADWDAQDRKELAALGVFTRPAVKGPKSIRVGVDKIGEMLSGRPPAEIPELYIWHNCKSSIFEYKNYQWPTLPDGRVNTSDNPLDRNNHGIDATRYALFSEHRRSGGYRYSKRRY